MSQAGQDKIMDLEKQLEDQTLNFKSKSKYLFIALVITALIGLGLVGAIIGVSVANNGDLIEKDSVIAAKDK